MHHPDTFCTTAPRSGEGGTGAAPLVFSDSVALPFRLGFTSVYKLFAEAGMTDDLTFDIRPPAQSGECVRVMRADGFDESCIVMRDVEGNEFCLD